MEVSNPRRILILSPPSAALSPVINALVPPPPPPPLSSNKDSSESPAPSDTADIQPVHHIKTPYYTAKVPVWTDTVTDVAAWSEEWKAQDGAAEVVRAVGAWIVAFAKPKSKGEMETIKTFLASIHSVIAHHGDSSPYDVSPADDVLQVAVALPQSSPSSSSASSALKVSADEWDDICREHGNWEFVDSTASGAPNQYGEKTGLPRLLETLTTIPWDSPSPLPSPSPSSSQRSSFSAALDEIDASLGSGDFDPARVAAELGARDPILLDPESRRAEGNEGSGNGEDDAAAAAAARRAESSSGGGGDVEALQRLMGRLQAAREAGAEMGEAQRRRVARDAVRDVMREF